MPGAVIAALHLLRCLWGLFPQRIRTESSVVTVIYPVLHMRKWDPRFHYSDMVRSELGHLPLKPLFLPDVCSPVPA